MPQSRKWQLTINNPAEKGITHTGVTSSVQDKYGNVTNYYRGGDTTNTNIIDSYNKTFNKSPKKFV